jgi:hypothetical protein
MKWADVGNKLRDVAGAALPAIGTALGGPAGAAVGVMLGKAMGTEATPDAVAAALSPDALVKLREVEADLQKAQIDADSAGVLAVNTTMQVEAKSDHWPTYTWRPAIGFAVALNTLAASVIVLAVFVAQILGVDAHEAIAQMPTTLGALAAMNGTALPILGIASWYRGKMQANPAVPSDNRG